MKLNKKLIEKRQSRLLLILYRSLIFLVVLIGLVFFCGILYGYFWRSSPSNPSWLGSSIKTGEGQIFTSIGKLRIPTKDTQPGIVILLVSFIYYPNDKAFSEELIIRIGDFRQIIRDYFGAFTVSELRNLEESEIKRELLNRFNSILRLGQIEVLYLSDFLIL